LRMDLWIAAKKNILKECAKRISEDKDGCLQDLLEHEQSKPTIPNRSGVRTISDTTPEAALSIFHEEGVNSAILRSSEGEEILCGHATRQLSMLNAPWSGEAKRVDRKTSDSFCVKTRLSIYIQAQPSVVLKFIERSEGNARASGFFARALITYPSSTQGMRQINPVSMANLEAYDNAVMKLMEKNVKASQDASFERSLIRFSFEAKERWFVVAKAIEWELRQGGRFEGFGDHASKLADNIARVAVVLHCADYGLEGEVSLDTLESAIHLCFWFSNEFISLFNFPSKEVQDAHILSAWLNEKRREGYRYLRKSHIRRYGPNRLRNIELLNLLLSLLEQNREIITFRCGKITVIDLYPGYVQDNISLQQLLQSNH